MPTYGAVPQKIPTFLKKFPLDILGFFWVLKGAFLLFAQWPPMLKKFPRTQKIPISTQKNLISSQKIPTSVSTNSHLGLN